jgi:MurNAc alpha-1-phosphate uridylyltransferase
MNTAFIFAAGRGERLRPLTDTRPKALMVVHGVPLIEHHVVRLAQAGFERILINHAYLGDQIKRHLGHGEKFGVDIIYLPEPPGALETGGALLHARPYLGHDPFITISADIFTDFNFSTLRQQTEKPVHLVLVPTEPAHPIGDFGLSEAQQITNTSRRYVFANIARFDPNVFQSNMPKHTPHRTPLAPLLRHWVEQEQVSGQLYKGLWFNIGNEAQLSAAQRRAG